MRGREGKGGGAPSTDLLVCFPTRAHLTLMPKPICSPARQSESNNRHRHHQNHHHHHLKKSALRGGGSQGSPLLWAKTKSMDSDVSEPTSPKVTCAGQIKIRPKPNASSCKNWQSVMEEIERIHNNKNQHNNNKKKKPTWVEALGFKKEIMQFLTCLRTIRFDFRCFGAFPHADITSDEDDDDEDEENEEEHEHGKENQIEENDANSRTVFSKWFMVLQEDQNNEKKSCGDGDGDDGAPPCAPPPNALLLMRCRSAPAKSWLEEREEEEREKEKREEEEKEEEKVEEAAKKAKLAELFLEDEEIRKKKENMVVMRYDNDFYKLSSDIAKETWVVGGIRDPFSRSRSWKR